MRIANLWQRLRANQKRSNRASHGNSRRPRLAVENLEVRAVPSAAPFGGAPVGVTVGAIDRYGLVLDLNALRSGNDGVADTVEARRNGDNLELVVNGKLTHFSPFGNVRVISVVGSSDADIVTVAGEVTGHVFVDGRGGANEFHLRGTAAHERFAVRGNRDVNEIRVSWSPIETPSPGQQEYLTIKLTDVFVSIHGAGGNDVVSIDSRPNVPVQFIGGSGFDTLVGVQNHPNHFEIATHNTGALRNVAAENTVVFSSVETLVGGEMNDTVRSQYGRGVYHLFLGDGADTLEYSADTPAVFVNLADGTATGFAGGIRGIENVQGGLGDDILIGNSSANRLDGGVGNDFLILFGGTLNDHLFGGAGNDILLGGAGDDHLFGGAGLDILIGNTGGDRLDGGADDDLMIGGSTTFDNNLPVLNAMREVWANPAIPYQQRIDYLRTVGVGGFQLNSSTIVPDQGNDWLVGGTGRDWFWGDALDSWIDLEPREKVN